MDQVFIKGLEVETLIGAYVWERNIHQCLQLDLAMAWDIGSVAREDGLEQALDYAGVAEFVRLFAARARFQLIETFADRLAVALMQQFGMPWLRLRVSKPGVNPDCQAVGVEIERGCR